MSVWFNLASQGLIKTLWIYVVLNVNLFLYVAVGICACFCLFLDVVPCVCQP